MREQKIEKMPKRQQSNRTQSRALSKQDELLNVQTQYFLKLEEIKLSKSDRIKRFIWNPQTKQFCGRTGASWCKYSINNNNDNINYLDITA